MSSEALRKKWDRIYRTAAPDELPQPARILAENGHLLPRQGTALDLAAGLGGNALVLARRGLDVHAVDLSGEAMARLSARAEQLGLTVRAEVRDVVLFPPLEAAYDVMVVSRFLERSLAGNLVRALKPGGLLFYQTFIREKADAAGPHNPAYLLRPNELLELFKDLRLLVYREEALIGDLDRGFRNEAMLVGRHL